MAQTTVATRVGGQRPLAGTGAMAGGVAAFVALEAGAKWLGGGYPTGQIVFLRTVLAVPGALVLLLAVDGLGGLRPTGLRAHVARGGLMVTAQFSYFAGLQHLTLPEATALSFSTPFFVAALSAPLTGERVTASQWAAVVGGFAGVLVVLRPTPAGFEPAGLLILLAAAAYAVALLITRRYAASQPAGAQVLYTHLVAAAASSLLVVPDGWTPPASTAELGLFALLGVLGAGNVALITAAFRCAPGAVCAPLYYTAIIWSTLLGWLLWDEHLDAATWAGTAIVVACGLTLVANEHRSSPGNRPHPQSSAHLVNRPAPPQRAAPNLRRRCAYPSRLLRLPHRPRRCDLLAAARSLGDGDHLGPQRITGFGVGGRERTAPLSSSQHSKSESSWSTRRIRGLCQRGAPCIKKAVTWFRSDGKGATARRGP